MPIREYLGRAASEEKFIGRYLAYDGESGKLEERMYEGQLQVKPDKMFADLSTPNGIPVLWQHGTFDGYGPAVGTVTDLWFENGSLMMKLELSEEAVEQFAAGGLEDLEAGLNRGLSVGLQFLDNPAIKLEKRDKGPDQLTYGRVAVLEVSLTPVPRIRNAGIIRRLDAAKAPETETDE